MLTCGRTLRAGALVAVAATCSVGASAAEAALGSGKASSFANRPNLVSLTLNQGATATNATFTFDKPVDVADLDGFSVFGYDACGPRADTLETTNPVRNGSSVTVVITGTPDANEVSGGAVRAGAVTTTTPGSGPITPNVADSIAASGARGESGTRGHSVAPDVVSARSSGSDTVTYVFDEALRAPAVAGAFTVVDAAGAVTPGQSVTTSGPEAVVVFPIGTVAGSRQASVGSGAVSDAFANTNEAGNTDIAGQSNTTQAPILESAQIASANQIRYTYKDPVANPISPPRGWLRSSPAATERARPPSTWESTTTSTSRWGRTAATSSCSSTREP